MNNYGMIYLLFNKLNNKCYIGQTTSNFNIRCRNHKNDKHKDKLHNSIRKYGWNNFDKLIIDVAYSKEELDILECFYIEKFQSIEFGYNLKTGGANGKASIETKKKMSLSRMGNKNPNFNKKYHLNDENKLIRKISAKNKKPIICIENNKYFESIRDAARIMGLFSSNIRNNLQGKTKSVKGFSFKYLNG